MTKSEAKDYVKKTLATGNKERIAEVMKHYFKFINSAASVNQDTYQTAKEIFT